MTQQSVVAINTIEALQTQVNASPVYENMVVLPGVAVDTFISISDYECNRPVKERALAQAKNSAQISKHLSSVVAVAKLDRVRNRVLWERTERVAREKGISHTLPFIKVNGHTRAFGWSNRRYFNDFSFKDSSILSVDRIGTAKLDDFDMFPHIFKRPGSLIVTVHVNLSDEEIYALVKKEYCGNVGVATRVEQQHMGYRKNDFAPSSDFVARDSWLTAFKLVDPKYRKNVDAAYAELHEALAAIESMGVRTKSSIKKYAGVRTSLIKTYYRAASHDVESKLPQWAEFWTDFYQDSSSHDVVKTLHSGLTCVASNASKDMIDMCTKAFESYIA
ncbi:MULTISPECIES: hypothetical protein [Enterobacter cloacae complex]|uniref:hypothetical protein n=1 Tax=Enterobacter cloacae complex TaxID=354276 RepID=UPI001012F92C|nr:MULTISPECIES: hypothetical protein [Enterobacter cloacae complex]MDQ6584460.1 hypothetical protein [Enterobacter hormaechei]RYA41431.1 hypothetical protein DD603_12975 [Enterobacter cloacae complex sp. 2DZ2F2B]RYA45713.1 hypothetical protein DD605_06295 [Enterobacter cloacae complex sp. 3DZ3S2B]